MKGRTFFASSALLAVLVASTAVTTPAQMCTPEQQCGDVTGATGVTAGDALAVLKRAVGLEVDLTCTCTGGEECPLGGTTRSGQSMCWDVLDTIIPVDPIDCIGTGQDGEYQKGLVPDYLVDNLNGTITDTRSTLMWEKLCNDGEIHDFDDVAFWWSGAFKKIQDLNAMAFAGYSDWRLPNIRELMTLPDFSQYNPAIPSVFNNNCLPGCTLDECSCTNKTSYWSSTTFQFNPSTAWTLDFLTGATSTTKPKWPASAASTPSSYVRAVRGGY